MDHATQIKDALKQRLAASIAAQIDQIAYVPDDIVRLAGVSAFDLPPVGQTPEAPPAAAPAPDLAAAINGLYDRVFYSDDPVTGLFHDGTEFRNLGYWDGAVVTQRQASERLQDVLIEAIAEKTGRILDVACGMGASTRRLMAHYPADHIWAINISERQIETTRQNAPGCHAFVMDAVDMTFADAFFDAVLCIEAAFHFETRRKFLADAWRILKPGGVLTLSDVLLTSGARLEQYPVFPSAGNHLPSVEAYGDLLAAVGFRDIAVRDAREQIWRGHFLHTISKFHAAYADRRIGLVDLTEVLWNFYHIDAITGPCVVVSARK